MSLTGAASNGFGKEPMSIQALAEAANNFEYSAEIPFRYWLRTADALQKQAQSYDRDGNEQDAYFFYMRHATLLLEHLSTHPERSLPANRAAYKKATQALNLNVSRLQALKPIIQARHDEYVKQAERRRTEREEWEKLHPARDSGATLSHGVDLLSFEDHASASPKKRKRRELHAGSAVNQSVALSLARKEQRKRPTQYPAFGGEAPAAEEGHSHVLQKNEEDVDDLAQRIVAAGRRGDTTFIEQNGTYGSDTPTFSPKTFNYPTIPVKNAYSVDRAKLQSSHVDPLESMNALRKDSQQSNNPFQRSMPPVRPPKEHFAYEKEIPPMRPPKERDWWESTDSQPHPPPLPGKELLPSSWETAPPQETTATPEISSADYTFAPAAFTESGHPLRTVFISPLLRHKFLEIAAPNTSDNKETCGILCGTLMSNAFFISKLVIPEQESTSDTCDTVNEEGLFEYVDGAGLMTLGWIHTHPSQSCFLSSRDLHTHAGYQVQMEESVALVCAPSRSPAFGVFRLTDPPGLKTVLACRKPGLFHPHDVENIYTSALQKKDEQLAGHVVELSGLEFEVVDLRP